MAVAFDAFSNSTPAVSPSWTHTPVGTPRAAIVSIVYTSGTDDVTGVTYGGTAMTEVTGSPNAKATGETGTVHIYFLGASVPTGAQTVSVTGSGANKIGHCVTLTAAADTEVVDSDGTMSSDSQANPTVTLSLASRTSFASLAFVSGQDGAASCTPFANWNSRHETTVGGTQTIGCYTYDTIGTTDVSAGWTQTAEDAVMVTVAVSEVAAGDAVPVGWASYRRRRI